MAKNGIFAIQKHKAMEYLKSERITLRALEPEDLDTFYRWENDTSLWCVGSAVEPYSRYILKEYIAYSNKTIYEKRQLRLIIERNADHETIGAIDLYDFDPFHMRAGVGILIDKAHQRLNFGSEALSLVIDYAFGFLHMKQLYAYVPTYNRACLQLMSKAHFEHSGTLHSWLRQGDDYIDVALLQLVR